MSFHPFADLIGLKIVSVDYGESVAALTVTDDLYNPHKVVHGGVLYSLADTGMGAAIYTTMEEGEACATVDIKINYFKPVLSGDIRCETTLVNRGKSIANLESSIFSDDRLVAKANGNYAIFKKR